MTEATSEKLAKALEEVQAPAYMIQNARNDYYHDFKSPLAMPEVELLAEARMHGLTTIAEGVIEGLWDASPEESDAWAKSPEGQATLQELLGGNREERRRRRKNQGRKH